MSRKFLFLGAILLLVLIGKKVATNRLTEKKKTKPTQVVDSTGATQKVKVFLIALGDNGVSGRTVGCGDSAVALEREISPTKAVLKASLDELFSLEDRTYESEVGPALYNTLPGSKLRVDTVAINEGGLAKIELSGTYRFTGVCEDARFIAQITQTALQFESVREVEIFLNGKNLKNLYGGD